MKPAPYKEMKNRRHFCSEGIREDVAGVDATGVDAIGVAETVGLTVLVTCTGCSSISVTVF